MVFMLCLRRLRGVVALAVATLLALSACGDTSAGADDDARLDLVAAFYPLHWALQQIAGPRATVTSLTKAGAEPHDLELSPQDVEKVADADLVVYLKGFQPAVDVAVRREAARRGYDVSTAARLTLPGTATEEGERRDDEAPAGDPHFWLDPVRLATVGEALLARLVKIDPAHAAEYRANARALTTRLDALHREFQAGLRRCASRDLVTSHRAFGYLAERYGLTQVGISGLSPEDEPKPAELARIANFVEKNPVRTIYYETLVSPAVARTVARETGAATEVLDPIEGLTRRSQGKNYLQVMRSNLTNLRKGQRCA